MKENVRFQQASPSAFNKKDGSFWARISNNRNSNTKCRYYKNILLINKIYLNL